MQHKKRSGQSLPVDVYGSGEDMDAIKAKAEKEGLSIDFHPATDHLDDTLHAYRYFPSRPSRNITAELVSLRCSYLSPLLARRA